MIVLRALMAVVLGTGLAMAQGDGGPPPVAPPAKVEVPAVAKEALAAARALATSCKGTHGAARQRALAAAAKAYEGVAQQHAAHPAVVAEASWHAAELRRRDGSLEAAARHYLAAAAGDEGRYGQRGLLGAADMQRRTGDTVEATKTYERCVALDPGSRRAHAARLWIGRMLLGAGDLDAAVERLQLAFREAPSPTASIEAADHLAKAWLQKGDLESAGYCIDHAEDLVNDAANAEPAVADRLRRAFERMAARRALQRARDERAGALDDAIQLDRDLRAADGG